MESNILIKLTDVSLCVDNKIILENISFCQKFNQIVTIIGPNGSGKTTLVKVILNLITATSGQIYKHPDLRIGYVPQKFFVNPIIPMTVSNFLHLQLKLNHSHSVYDEIIELIKIKSLLNYQLNELSGGELQKILIAASLLSKPNLLVLDEPTQGIDLEGQIKFYSLLEQIKQKFNISILMVSHDLHFVMKKTDIVLCINKHICCIGNPEEISNNIDYQKLFGKDVLNLISLYKHEHDHNHEH